MVGYFSRYVTFFYPALPESGRNVDSCGMFIVWALSPVLRWNVALTNFLVKTFMMTALARDLSRFDEDGAAVWLSSRRDV